MFSKHKLRVGGDFQDRESRKPFECFALIGSVTLFWAVIGYIFHMRGSLYAKLIGRIAFSTWENIAHTEFYIQGLFPIILALYVLNK